MKSVATIDVFDSYLLYKSTSCFPSGDVRREDVKQPKDSLGQPESVDRSPASPCYLAFLWDSFRWRFVAVFYIVWWLAKRAPMKDLPAPTRWDNVKWAWSTWRSSIMYPHERHKYRPIDEILAELRERNAR